ncbi:ABC-type multidrug transport system ATPase subunit [Saccharothrix coeruleofusca]|uniref:ABC transporter ATP-binding protein n=1 Tax=Saccharothrix coeruleofusca TaxID=33919 RepID=UPI0027DD88AA|nr:ABC transporter ATP-binding protein [Saccharothrix coeruleofusca]MBP2338592.1 ABC-type multidrug transport system ATPase subunit [Saccharothrix coeruleofusca]
MRDLTRRFGTVTVLDRICFTVDGGQAVAVVGPNGAGKSTLLRCLVQADRADSGEVLLDGEPLDETDPRVRAAVACALDDADFFPDLSVREHVDLLARAHASEVDVNALIAEVGLGQAADQLPVALSSGQRQRLVLASVLARPRRLLVLDEPEQRLDTRSRGWLADRLRAEKAAGVAIVLASHDRDLIDAVADRLVDISGPARADR